MRKVRDYDAELKALGAKARALKARKVEQLGALVTATGADIFDAATLAGILLDAVGTSDAATKEEWASKGATFFQRRARKAGDAVGGDGSGTGSQSGSSSSS